MTAELRIKAFIKREERISAFEGALLASTAYVNLAADYYSEFADVQPKTEYLSPDGFAAYLNRKKRDLIELAPSMDADIRRYWLEVLRALSIDHQRFASEFATAVSKFSSKRSKRLAPELRRFQAPRLKSLGDDIVQAQANFPSYTFSEPKHVRYWQDIAVAQSRRINKACDLHKEMFAFLEREDAAVAARRAGLTTLALRAASPAVTAGRLILRVLGVPS